MAMLTDKPLKCECHRYYVLAVVVEGENGRELVIQDKRNRETHEIRLTLDKLLRLMQD